MSVLISIRVACETEFHLRHPRTSVTITSRSSVLVIPPIARYKAMNLQQLVKKMQGGGFNSSRAPMPSPFAGQQSIKPSLDDLDRILLQQAQWLRKQEARQRAIGNARFSERTGG